MIRKPSRQDAKRLVCGSLVAATSFAGLGVAFASSADAASSALTAKPAQPYYKAGTAATINVTSTGTPQALKYRVTSGPDATNTNIGQAAGSPTFTLTNNGTAGTDQITIWDDTNANNVLDSGEISTTTSVIFTGAPTSFSISPSANRVGVNSTETYTVTGKDSNGNPSAGGTVGYVRVSEPFTTTTTQGTTNGVPNGTYSCTTPNNIFTIGGTTSGTETDTPAAGNTTVTSQTGTCSYTAVFQGTATLGSTDTSVGTAKVTIASTAAGTVTFSAGSDSTNATTGTYTVVAAPTGTANNAVKSLTVTPATQSAGVGSNATFTLSAKDAATDGIGISGATINYVITGGPDQTGTGVYPVAGTTDANGNLTFVFPNSSTKGAGTDQFTFYVNQSGTGTVTSGPDSGEPTATASATFAQQPVVQNLTITGTSQATGATNPSNYVVVPTGTASVTLTVKATATVNGVANTPVAGATVRVPSATKDANGNVAYTVTPNTVTTGSDGTATVTYTPASTTTASDNTVTASVDNGTGTAITSQVEIVYAAPGTASKITLTPQYQTLQAGGSATVVAKLADQFGNPVTTNSTINFAVTGRNNGKTGSFATGSSGQATFTYQDGGSLVSSGADTITATLASNNAVTATGGVNWVLNATPTQLTTGYTDGGSTCTAATAGINRTAATTSATAVCALVQNAAGDALAGQTVTFAVNAGFVTSAIATGTTAPTTQTITATTNQNGIAVAYVGSATPANQTVTITSGSLSKTLSVNYSGAAATSVSISPKTATIGAGKSGQFTVTALDSKGNPSSGQTVTFQVSGPGTINGTSSASAVTNTSGQATVTVSVPAGTASGSGTVTALVNNLSAAATYTAGASAPAKVVVGGLTSVVVRNLETATATVTDASGTPVADGTSVSFTTSGTQTTTGTATTTNGVASFTFRTEHAGDLTVTATTNSVNGSATVTVSAQPTTITVGGYSNAKGVITLVALLDPASQVSADATVNFYYRKTGLKGWFGPIPVAVDSKGRAQININRSSGYTYTFYASITGNKDIKSSASEAFSVKAK